MRVVSIIRLLCIRDTKVDNVIRALQGQII